MCALINKYNCPAVANIEDSQAIATQMRETWKDENILEKHLQELNKKKPLRWSKFNAAVCLFPSLTENDLRNLTFGTCGLTTFISAFCRSRIIPNQNGKILHNRSSSTVRY